MIVIQRPAHLRPCAAERRGSPPSSAAMVVINDGTEAKDRGRKMAWRGLTCSRAHSSGESIIMIGSSHSPIRRMMPITAIRLISVCVIKRARSAPDPGGRRVGKDRDGWIAFVEQPSTM